MRVLNAHITWNLTSECHHQSDKVEIFLGDLGIITVSNFLSEETRKKIYDEAVLAVQSKLEAAAKNAKEV